MVDEAAGAQVRASRRISRLRHPLSRQLPGARARAAAARPAAFPTCSPAASPSSTRPRSRTSPSYLRLLANSDDDPAFIRAVTTPKRGVGGTTLEALGTYAGESPCLAVCGRFRGGFAHRVQPRQLAPLLEFCEFINRLEYRADARSRPNQVMPRPAERHRLRSLAADEHEEDRDARKANGTTSANSSTG